LWPKKDTQSEPETDRTESENIMLLKARLSSFITYAAVLSSEMENAIMALTSPLKLVGV
jgi:hypothetical protein